MVNGKNHMKNGKGIFTDSTGKYIGMWKDDKQHGKGSFQSIVDNSIFEGEWVGGYRSGRGSLRFSDGKTVEQIWTNGVVQENIFGRKGIPLLPSLYNFKQ